MTFVGLAIATTARGDYRRPELVLTRGPAAEADVGDGSYLALYGTPWALALTRANELVLARHAGAWAIVTPSGAWPTMPVGARHVALAFDRSARPIVAWQDGAGILVRQWDTDAVDYATRGPFAGVDPHLYTDALAARAIGDDDVHLWYLTPDRLSVAYRLERERYEIEDVRAALEPPGTWHLDLVAAGVGRFTLYAGRADRAPAGELPAGVALVSDLYGLPGLDEGAATAAAAGETRTTVAHNAEEAETAEAVASAAGRLDSTNAQRSIEEAPATANATASGSAIALVIAAGADDEAATAAATASGDQRVTTIDAGEEEHATATATAAGEVRVTA